MFQEDPTKVYEVNLVTGQTTLVKDPLIPASESERQVNAIGFNIIDGFIYGSLRNDPRIVRVDPVTYNVSYFNIPQLQGKDNIVGDVNLDGFYYLRNNKDSKLEVDIIDLRDVDGAGPLYTNTLTLSENINFADWAFSPVDNNLYAVQADKNALVRIDPTTMQITFTIPVSGDGFNNNTGGYGAVYFDREGNFYASNNNSGKIHILRAVHEIPNNATSTTAELFVQGPSSDKNDGARCALADINLDYGDNPVSYKTLDADDGPSHYTTTEEILLTIGDTISFESNAVGTDAISDADDGLDETTLEIVNNDELTINVPYINKRGGIRPALLIAWLDVNENGVFDSGEARKIDVNQTIGTETFTWNGLSCLANEFTYLRIRISYEQLNSTGRAVDNPSTSIDERSFGQFEEGEVEDYRVRTNTILPSGIVTNEPCFGEAAGSIDLTVTGGSGDVSYSWTGPNAFTSTEEDIDNLLAGTYTVTITDNLYGCSKTLSFEVTQPDGPLLIDDAIIKDIACNGDNDGSINLSVSGGTPPYSFDWSDGSVKKDLLNVPGGEYTVVVTDANGCTLEASYIIEEPDPLLLTLTPTDVLCNGEGTGSIDATIEGGTPPYSLNWSDIGNSTEEDRTGLFAGNYTLTVTDANGCTVSETTSINEPSSPLNVISVVTNVSINGGNDGAIDLSISGGTPPYTIQWEDGVTTEDRENLTAGVYKALVTDANGCTASVRVVVGEPTPLLVDAIAEDTVCFGESTGSIDLTVTGGVPPYTYSWVGPNGFTSNQEDLDNLPAGEYDVTVTDANGAQTFLAVFIIESTAPISINSLVSDISCNGANDGAILLNVFGGFPPYTYTWSNGATTKDIDNLSAGTYSLVITDKVGCTLEQTFTIEEPAPLALKLLTENILCKGDSTGTISIQVNGGTPPYRYLWSNGATTPNLSDLPAGEYGVEVTDANDCLITDTITLSEPAEELNARVASIKDVSCNGASDGAVNLDINGGTPPYDIVWTSVSRTLPGNTKNINNLPGGDYTATITDANGCTLQIPATINEPPALELSAKTSDVACKGANGGDINLSVEGGTPPYSYQWSNGETTEDLFGLFAGSYTVEVTDDNGCTERATFNINEPSTSLEASFTAMDVTINGGNDGSIDVSVTGGVPPYDYYWLDGPRTQDRVDLSAGLYFLGIVDANGCDLILIVPINEPTVLEVTVTTTDNLCFDDSTGTITTEVSGGVPPYTYRWVNEEGDIFTDENLDNLPSGRYELRVTDANGATEFRSVEIFGPADELEANGLVGGEQCTGDANGSIKLDVTGGTPPYTYQWSNGSTKKNIADLSPGLYDVIITDANGCTLEETFSVPGFPPIQLVATPTPVSCNGDNTGSINLSVIGGNPPYTYEWSNGGTTEDLSGLTAGSYTVLVTDQNGCTATLETNITEPDNALSISDAIVTDVAIFGESTGAIDITVEGGTPPYTYQWSNGATTEDLSGVPSGSYTVTVTDVNGCVTTAAYSINEPNPLTVTIISTNVSCKFDADGTIDLTVEGGIPPYTFLWNNGATTEDLENLPAGTYTVLVTDSEGATALTSVKITEPLLGLRLTTTKENVSCNGESDGSVDLITTGGTPPYSYQWSNGATTADLENIPAGRYEVVVTDANGCTETTSVIINEPDPLNSTFRIQDILCFGESTGAIDLNVSGGTPPYSYQWNNGATTADLEDIPAGDYEVVITDANGCTFTTSTTVGEPDSPISITTNFIQNVSCDGLSDGVIGITVTGGTTPYSYSWSNGAITEDIFNLAEGSYTVMITDANGCTAEATFDVTAPEPLEIVLTPTDVLCFGENTGSIDAEISGGTPPYSYTWSDGITTEDRTGLSSGEYTLEVTDANGCTASASTSISQPDAPLSVSGVVTPVTISGLSDGAIDLTVSGGTAPYSFLWNDGATTEDRTGLSAGIYSVVVTDANGCSERLVFVVPQPTPLEVIIDGTDSICFGTNDGEITLEVSGGVPPYTFEWEGPDGFTSDQEDLTGLSAGHYAVTVTDNNGATAFAEFDINQSITPLIVFGGAVDISCNGLEDGEINQVVTGGTPPYSFAWSNGATSQNLSNLTAGDYNVTITDALGCTTDTSYTITEPEPIVLSATVTDVLCKSEQTGAIDLTVTGGTPPYSYSWGDGATVEDRTRLSAGTYSVTVTDANGCTEDASFNISEPDTTLSASSTVNNISCNGTDDGSIDLTVSGGTPPYNFVWSNGATTEDLTNLSAGDYTVNITDSNGCTFSLTETITEPDSLIASSVVTDVSCFGEATGAIDLSVSGGTPPYTYSWSNGATTEDINGLLAGEYTVTVTDINGCTTELNTTVEEPDEQLEVTADISGDSNQNIDLTVTGGTPPYSYLWSDGSTEEDRTDLAEGEYFVFIIDANGCVLFRTFVIEFEGCENVRINVIYIDDVKESAEGAADGSIDIEVEGGTPPYTYTWEGPNGYTSNEQDPTGLTAGKYTVEVIDANGCRGFATHFLRSAVPYRVFVRSKRDSRDRRANGRIDVTVEGGVPPYRYRWSNGATSEDLINIPAGTYTLEVYDQRESKVTLTESIGDVTNIINGTYQTLKLYPIPAKEQLHVQLPDVFNDVTLELMTLEGQVVQQSTFSGEKTVLLLDKLPTGMYLIRAQTKEHIFFKQFIKN
ncbi:hypothetical protein GCM10023331_35970 [Algivirga pacifica]|uniref:Ig-like domain-containing protein n=1 Tax=Algivirga pacifica TaxID=1162670 RepID=A0ABP9DPK2_9BACT